MMVTRFTPDGHDLDRTLINQIVFAVLETWLVELAV